MRRLSVRVRLGAFLVGMPKKPRPQFAILLEVGASPTPTSNFMQALRILEGNCLETLKQVQDDSIDCCVTSPPYYGLRDYGMDDQIGNEETADEFIARLVNVFREVRRVLKPTGTCWVNMGDSYALGPTGRFKRKDMLGVPWMLAFALRADGWYLRQDIIWHKPNPMPEPVKDRCTKSHEYIFMLTKSEKYFFDADAIKEPWKQNAHDIRRAVNKHPGYSGKHTSGYNGAVRGQPVGDPSKGRNKRSVWTVPTRSYKGAHFAVFPPDLIKPCILSGCPVGGVVLDPFGGSGTTAEVALINNRMAVLCELNPEYIQLIKSRLAVINNTPLLPL